MCLAILSVVILFIVDTKKVAAVNPDAPYAQQRDQWRTEIEKLGGEAAYEEAATVATELQNSRAHFLMHAFGEALFRTKGIEALSVCDHRFQWGCFHEFTGTAISELGAKVVDDFIRVCENHKRPGECMHGVGHGILSNEGYETPDLAPALEQCDVTNGSMWTGCVGGVFMEFNVRRVIAVDSLEDPRPFDPRAPFAPCLDGQIQAYARECVYWLPMWWHYAEENVPMNARETMRLAQYCDTLGVLDLKTACFEGIGYLVGRGVSDAHIRSECEAVSTERKLRQACLDAAYKRLKAFERS